MNSVVVQYVSGWLDQSKSSIEVVDQGMQIEILSNVKLFVEKPEFLKAKKWQNT